MTDAIISRGKINKAGEKLRSNKYDQEVLDLLNIWRALHIYPLNTFQTTLKNRLKKNNIPFDVTAQRLKRTPTIIDKLSRQPEMELGRMQDIGGLRAVLLDIESVRKLENLYTKDKNINDTNNRGVFLHKLKKNHDYITNPKNSGYRGVHLIYETFYPEKPEYSKLFIELQIRTKLQHIWATAVETIGTFIGQGLKFNRGDEDWKDLFALLGSAFALMEKSNKLEIHRDLDESEIYKKIADEVKRLDVKAMLSGFVITTNNIENIKDKRNYYYCLIELHKSGSEKVVTLKTFPKSKEKEATTALSEAENMENVDAVLVSIDHIKKLKKAYPNFFLDTVDFLKILDDIINKYN
jgi:putative GTP pyrophosphokinase